MTMTMTMMFMFMFMMMIKLCKLFQTHVMDDGRAGINLSCKSLNGEPETRDLDNHPISQSLRLYTCNTIVLYSANTDTNTNTTLILLVKVSDYTPTSHYTASSHTNLPLHFETKPTRSNKPSGKEHHVKVNVSYTLVALVSIYTTTTPTTRENVQIFYPFVSSLACRV